MYEKRCPSVVFVPNWALTLILDITNKGDCFFFQKGGPIRLKQLQLCCTSQTDEGNGDQIKVNP